MMRGSRPSVDLTFYETYYFAHAVKSVLEDQFEYIIQIHEFNADRQILLRVPPFRRFSAFHAFIEFVLAELISDEVEEVDLQERKAYIERFGRFPGALDPHPARLPIELAMGRYRIEHQSFEQWLLTSRRSRVFKGADENDVHDYYDELRLGGEFEQLLAKATREVFFVLFQNRNVLLLFNDMMARGLEDETADDDPDATRFFEKPGVLKRVGIPQWVQRAVFFRDRGRCVLCDCDLSGLVSAWSEENYDHMVPLAAGGLNDCTNIQLLCRECNAAKAAGRPITSSRYEAWYEDGSEE